MSLLTSDYIASWYTLKDIYSSSRQYLIKQISTSTNLSVQPQSAIQGEAGTVIIDLGGQKDETEISSEALILFDNEGNYLVESDYQYLDIIDLLNFDYQKLMIFFLFTPEYLYHKLNYFLTLYSKFSINALFSIDNLITTYNYSEFNTKWQSNSSTISDVTTRNLYRQSSFVLNAFYVKEIFRQTVRNSISSSIASRFYNFQTLDEFFYILKDLDYIYDPHTINSFSLNNVNLLKTANITIGESVDCNLTYFCNFKDKFAVSYDSTGITSFTNDFIARTAKNYDCVFFVNGDNYKIKSGSISIEIGYDEIFAANTGSRAPFFSPQSYQISGSLKIISKYDENTSIPLEGNCSLVIGSRYIELGQSTIKSSITRSLNPESIQEIDVRFTAYARAGSNIYSDNWIYTYMNYIRS